MMKAVLLVGFVVPILCLCVVFAVQAEVLDKEDRMQEELARAVLTESVRRSTAAHLALLRTHGMRAVYKEDLHEED